MSNTKKSARFWVWANGGWVKLSLQDGETLSHDVGYPTDEGYHRESTTWAVRYGHVMRIHETEGRDCDGRHSSHTEHRCRIALLADMVSRREQDNDGEEVRIPRWERIGRRCHVRDYTAEAAGY